MISMFFTTPFTLSVRTETKTTGRVAITYVPDSTTYMGRFDPDNKSRAYLNDKLSFVGGNSFFCASACPVEEGDRINFNAQDYEVLSVVNPFSKSHHLELIIDKVGR